MTVTVGAFTFDNLYAQLTSQPFGYNATDTSEGMTARQWTVTGLATPSQWLNLLTVYDAWRSVRITQESTSTSLVVGATVSFSGTGPGGSSWSNVACWFSEPPSGEQSGKYISLSFTVIDANQQLQVIQKGQTGEEATTEEPDLGTYTLGGVVLKLTKPIDSYLDGPEVRMTLLGKHYIAGPKVVQETLDIQGYFDTGTYPSGVASINNWYESRITTISPSVGSYFPITIPSYTAERVIVGGSPEVRYTVSILLAKLL